jgi:Uma2 family endonuclease
MRVKVAESGLYVYPDVVVSCDGPKFIDGQFDTLENPVLVIEIFSPSTRRLDQFTKAPYYRRAQSVQEFLVILQDEPTIERYSRRENDWIASDYQGLESVLPLDSLGLSIPLSKIYHRVTFRLTYRKAQ